MNSIPTNLGLDHIGIVVPNAQEAADFLIDVFNAKFDWEVKREPEPRAGERGWDNIFGVHPDSYLPHVIMLKCGEHPLTQYIEIFEWYTPEVQIDGWHKFSDIGNSYISFMVQDLDRVMAHIKEYVIPKWEGTRFIQDPPMKFPLRGEICTSTFLVSPWGMWIELTCWTNTKFIGRHIQELPTPVFLVDLDSVDHNIKLMSERINGWRIPCKAHKCPALAKYILGKSHANGVVLLTLAEAENFARAGINNIYLANQVTTNELERLSLLAKQIKCLRVAVDDMTYLQQLAALETPIEVLVELNINHHRCGVNNIEDAVALARFAAASPNIIFAGITGYEGHTPILPPTEKTQATHAAHDILAKAKAAIESAGIKVNVVSGGGSCNYIDCLRTGILTEIQAGGGAIGDLLYYQKANLKDHGHKMGALILTEIISAQSGRAIGNAGFKAVGWHPFGGLPELRDHKDVRVLGLSAEHIKFETAKLQRGDKVVLIPGYTDAMGFLHKQIYAIRNDHVEHVWEIVR